MRKSQNEKTTAKQAFVGCNNRYLLMAWTLHRQARQKQCFIERMRMGVL